MNEFVVSPSVLYINVARVKRNVDESNEVYRCSLGMKSIDM